MEPPDHLSQIGEALFGLSWQSDLARAISVSPRTIRRWLDGEFPIPAGVWKDLRELCLTRAAKIVWLADQLRTGVKVEDVV